MPPFFLVEAKQRKFGKNPLIGQSQEASELEQNSRKSGKCSKPEELNKEWIGAKQQKIKQMLQTGRIEQRVDWSKTTENQGNAPNRKNYTKSDLE